MFPAGSKNVRARWVSLRNGIRLRIAEAGEPDQPVVLLVHGWASSLYMWRDWFQPLAASGRRVIAIDLPGHGLSDKPDDASVYRVESMVAVVRELIDSEGLGVVDVVAQSMAGTIATELALEVGSPVRRTALVNPACFGQVRLHWFWRLVSPPVVDVVLPRLVSRWIVSRTHRGVYGDPSRITRQDEDEYWAPSQFPSFARAMRMLLHEFRWARLPADDMVARLRTLPTSLLVVLGTRDHLVLDAMPYVTTLQAKGAPIEMAVIVNGGHAVNEERPGEVIEEVLRFLAS